MSRIWLNNGASLVMTHAQAGMTSFTARIDLRIAEKGVHESVLKQAMHPVHRVMPLHA